MSDDLRISVLCTGGTMSKVYPKSIGGYAFEFGETSAASRVLSRVPGLPSILVERVLAKDSTELTTEDRTLLENRILHHLKENNTNRFVITHGTDTMIETGLFLLPLCRKHQVIVCLTGSKIPEAFKDSDADFNLGFAFGVISAAPVLGNAFICMNGQCFPVENVKRMEDGSWKKI